MMIWFWIYFIGLFFLMIVSPPVNRHYVVFDFLWPIFLPVGLVLIVFDLGEDK